MVCLSPVRYGVYLTGNKHTISTFFNQTHIISYVTDYGLFSFVRSVRPKRTGVFASLNEKVQGAREHFDFPAITLQIPGLWSSGAGELSGSDP